MDEEQFGSTSDYYKAFKTIREEGIAYHHERLLRVHLAAPKRATTWANLAYAVGYPNGGSVHLQYGKFARRLARQLGLTNKPRDTCGNRWWLWALVCWDKERDPESGHTVFVLRRPAIKALHKLGIAGRKGWVSKVRRTKR